MSIMYRVKLCFELYDTEELLPTLLMAPYLILTPITNSSTLEEISYWRVHVFLSHCFCFSIFTFTWLTRKCLSLRQSYEFKETSTAVYLFFEQV